MNGGLDELMQKHRCVSNASVPPKKDFINTPHMIRRYSSLRIYFFIYVQIFVYEQKLCLTYFRMLKNVNIQQHKHANIRS